ncbi:MAG: hypothetical protein U1D55_10465 [Phycisphaerae bacterium]
MTRSRSAIVALLGAGVGNYTSGQCTNEWVTTGHFVPGLSGSAGRLAVFDDGSGPALFVGGSFEFAGDVAVKNIAKWDGTTWSPVGGGLNGGVSAMRVHNGELYVGGAFTLAGSLPVLCLAKWSNGAWSAPPPFPPPLGSTTAVAALGAFSNELYVSGYSLPRVFLYRLTGNTWSSFPHPTYSPPSAFIPVIRNIHEFGGELVVTGSFDAAGSPTVVLNGVAAWNGTQWHPLGNGVGPSTQSGRSMVTTSAVYDVGLFVGGAFTDASSVPARAIARWDGANWTEVGGGLAGDDFFAPQAMLPTADRLVVAGAFNFAGGAPHRNIVAWTGTNWSALGSGLNGRVSDLVEYAGRLIASGDFGSSGNAVASRVAAWNGSTWSALAPPNSAPFGPLNWLQETAGELYCAGAAPLAAGGADFSLLHWNGQQWVAVTPAPSGTRAMTSWRGQPVAVGLFNSAVGTPATNVAAWDGVCWNALGSGVGSIPDCAIEFRGDLIVGGQFTTAGGVPASRVARWDGNSWSPLGAGFNSSVRNLAVFRDQLVAYGFFTTAGGHPIARLAAWDGSDWSSLGGASGPYVDARLAVWNDRLIVAGPMTQIGGVSVNNVAAWDGAGWSAIGAGLGDSSVSFTSLAVHQGELYVSGTFGSGVPNLAKWNGTAWSPVGNGTAPYSANSMASFGDSLFIVGEFALANGSPSAYFARLCVHGPPGDLNNDNRVEESDLGILLQAWQISSGGDVDGDGDTDESDLSVLLSNWYGRCP